MLPDVSATEGPLEITTAPPSRSRPDPPQIFTEPPDELPSPPLTSASPPRLELLPPSTVTAAPSPPPLSPTRTDIAPARPDIAMDEDRDNDPLLPPSEIPVVMSTAPLFMPVPDAAVSKTRSPLDAVVPLPELIETRPPTAVSPDPPPRRSSPPVACPYPP